MNKLSIINNETLPKILKSNSNGFVTITEEKLALIESKMGEVDRAVRSFSKQNTQVDMKLRTLTMLSVGSPYRTLRQILAQIEKKRSALQESYFNVLEKQVEVEKLKTKDDELSKIQLAKAQCGVNSSNASVEAALKDIGMLLQIYDEIKESYNIPENWDEADMEKEEVSHNIKGAFRNGLRDFIVNGRIGMGTIEWFEQMGIGPIEANKEIINFLGEDKDDYEAFIEFLREMAEKYKDHYKKVMKMLGIKTLIDTEWLYREV